jgi:hypothetical protein
LLARAVERFAGGEGMHVARLTVELLRPVPLTPLTIALAFARPGKKVQLVSAALRANDVEVARALALRIRRRDLPLPNDLPPEPSPPPGPDAGTFEPPPWGDGLAHPAFHSDAVEHRFVAGGFDRPARPSIGSACASRSSPATPTSPLSRVAAAADFGNGISWVLSRLDGWQFINPDLTIYVHRPCEGEWVCLDAVTHVDGHGVGMSESRLWDRRGSSGARRRVLLLERVRGVEGG